MNEFTSGFWPWYIAILTVVSIVVCAIFLYTQQSAKIVLKGGKVDTTGHVWDEDLREWNNPLPNWWRWLFYITVVFGLVYVALYPGLGLIRGAFGWSSGKQYEDEMKRADAQLAPLYQKYNAMDMQQLAADPAARQIGQNLYLNYCAQCHASDAGGSKGFPNLRDSEWHWGGTPAEIETTIAKGRVAVMPPFGQALGSEGVKDVANYVMSLSGMAADSIRVARGKPLFMANCAACHGAEGKGNPALGAPNLTDKSWLYGSGEPTIIQTISQGRKGVMPAWEDRLGNEKVKLLAAYVWGLSNTPAK
jgi:cytochrome c oxidase cbb3-type subunit 3